MGEGEEEEEVDRRVAAVLGRIRQPVLKSLSCFAQYVLVHYHSERWGGGLITAAELDHKSAALLSA